MCAPRLSWRLAAPLIVTIAWPTRLSSSSVSIRSVFQTRRSEEHKSELQSLMRISYAVFCLKQTKITTKTTVHRHLNNTREHQLKPTPVLTWSTDESRW